MKGSDSGVYSVSAITNPRLIKMYREIGLIINPECVCVDCNARPAGRKSGRCMMCANGRVDRPRVGRPRTYDDDTIVELVNDGVSSVNELLVLLGVKHKTTLIARLRGLHDAKRIQVVDRTRKEGLLILPMCVTFGETSVPLYDHNKEVHENE